jgi:endonuclease-3
MVKKAAKKKRPKGVSAGPKKKTAKKKKAKKKKAKKKKAKKKKAKKGPLSEAGIQRVYEALAATIVPKSDLEYTTAFELLVAVVLSAQATDVSVNEATRRLYAEANTPRAILELGVEGLTPFIRKIGLFNAKSKNVISLCADLLEKHGGEVPEDRPSLEALAGVGRKTANVVLNVAFGQPTIAVDTHVHRVANRLGIVVSDQPLHTEAILVERTPEEHLLEAHHYLILHGRYLCKARKPECWRCPVAEECLYEDKLEAP